jgi:DNA-binding beta-propeller fold protein YncE
MATLDTIAVIDPVGRSARWWQQGPFGMQHGPRVTPDGQVIVFNNFLAPKRSSVQIIDPQTRKVTWEFRGGPARPLYSLRSGGAEILANGNILIVETDRGRVLEITPDEELAWEFRSPYRTGKQRNLIAMVYSLDRIDESKVAWLDR